MEMLETCSVFHISILVYPEAVVNTIKTNVKKAMQPDVGVFTDIYLTNFKYGTISVIILIKFIKGQNDIRMNT